MLWTSGSLGALGVGIEQNMVWLYRVSVSAKIWLWTQNLPGYGYLDMGVVMHEDINFLIGLGVEEYDNRMELIGRR